MHCCNPCYSICDTIAACFDQLLVYLPVPYEPELITVKITNAQGVSVTGVYNAELGYVDIDLSDFATGFFSAYGGPYTIEFFNSDTGAKITFVAKDGNTYVCISFNCTNQTGGDGTVFVNAFSDVVPEPYA